MGISKDLEAYVGHWEKRQQAIKDSSAAQSIEGILLNRGDYPKIDVFRSYDKPAEDAAQKEVNIASYESAMASIAGRIVSFFEQRQAIKGADFPEKKLRLTVENGGVTITTIPNQ